MSLKSSEGCLVSQPKGHLDHCFNSKILTFGQGIHSRTTFIQLLKWIQNDLDLSHYKLTPAWSCSLQAQLQYVGELSTCYWHTSSQEQVGRGIGSNRSGESYLWLEVRSPYISSAEEVLNIDRCGIATAYRPLHVRRSSCWDLSGLCTRRPKGTSVNLRATLQNRRKREMGVPRSERSPSWANNRPQIGIERLWSSTWRKQLRNLSTWS